MDWANTTAWRDDKHLSLGIRCVLHWRFYGTLDLSRWIALNTLSTSHAIQGWGLLSQFSPFRYFPHFPLLSKQTLSNGYHIYIWQVSSQLSCGDTCQIWMWFRESNRYFCKMENFSYGEISEQSFSNPHPSSLSNDFTPASTKLKGGYIGFALSVSPSVDKNRVHSVSSAILIGSISYLQILASNFRWCVTCIFFKKNFKIKKFEVLANFLNLWRLCFDLGSNMNQWYV